MITIASEIENLKLTAFEGYNLSQLFFSLSEHDRISPQKDKVSVNKIIFRLFLETDKWVYENGQRRILFFLQNSNRKDVIELTKNVANLVDRRDFIYLKKRRSFHFNKSIKYLKLLLNWNTTLGSTRLSRFQKNKILNLLLRMVKLREQLEKVDYSSLSLLVNFYDAEPLGNYVAQTFKKVGCTTATLSHGLVLAERDGSIIDYAGIELKGFTSDYFLAWNNFTKLEAIKAGIDVSKINVVGISKFINYKYSEIPIKKKVLGLVLDNSSGDIFNRDLIIIANEFCEQNNYSYTIRFHPSFKGTEYDDLIDSTVYLGQNTSPTIESYCKCVELTILANSTVFIELVYLEQKVYRYGTKGPLDKYRDFNYNTFCSFEDLQKLYTSNKDESEELFDEICTVRDVEGSYKRFFRNYL